MMLLSITRKKRKKLNHILKQLRAQRQEIIEIKTTELETMAKEEFDAIKNYKKEAKELKPHFETIESKKIIRLRFNHNGDRSEKKKSYAKIGYDKAKEELDLYFSQEMAKLNQQSHKPVEIDEEEDNGNIWISLY